ncbi:MAG TPA: hypothetical protein GX697_01495 [Firmicutes bacterium]|nr:hypothetical protein [Bacillota bacterium]
MYSDAVNAKTPDNATNISSEKEGYKGKIESVKQEKNENCPVTQSAEKGV